MWPRWLIAFQLAACLSVPLSGLQQPLFFSRADLVPLYVSAIDKRDGRPIAGLKSDDFVVSVDGRDQKLSLFSDAPHPVSVAIVLDLNFGMSALAAGFARSFAAAIALVEALGPDDEVSLGGINRQFIPLTTKKGEVAAALRESDTDPRAWRPASGNALDWTLEALNGSHGRRIVLLLTDGAGYAVPAAAGEEFAGRASRTNVTAMAIGFEDEHVDLRFMTHFAQFGGSAAMLLRDANLQAVFTEIADDWHHEYLLGFEPITDGKEHTIVTRVVRPNAVVRARRSYIAAVRSGAPTERERR